ncbi:MAG: type II secretion system protein GspN [Desulfobacterium sp.]|nr:type II secretion system protein GspN [Desulfobacterium sp.]
MGKANIKILYAAYIIGIGLFFLYYLFPSKTFSDYLKSKIEQAAPDFTITIEDVRPVFPLGLKFVNLRVENKGTPVLDAQRLSVTPGFLSLFAGRIAVDIDCKAYKGEIEAALDFKGKDFMVSAADVEFNHVQIGDILFLKNRMPHNLIGSLDGQVNYETGENSKQIFKSDFVLTDFIIEFSSPFHGLEKLSLKKIEANFESDRSEVKVNRFLNKGGDVDGSLSGTVLINRKLEKSVLNLNGTINPNPVFTDKLGELGPIVKRILKKSSEDGFPVKIQGTFEKPRFF